MESRHLHVKAALILGTAMMVAAYQGCENPGTTTSPPGATNNPPNQPTSEASKINTAGWSDSPYISRDGQRLYFMYSRYNFMPALLGTGTPVLLGPDRPGHNNNDINPYEDSDIYVSTRNADGNWGKPVNLGAVNNSQAQCCMMVVDGPPLKLYYQSSSSSNGNELFYRQQNSDGSWGPEVPLSINSSYDEENPHVSPNDDAIWFTSNRPGSVGGSRDIWFSAKVNGNWTAPVNVGAPINTAAMEDQFWVNTANGEVYFNREQQIFHTTWNGSTFSTPALVSLGLNYYGEASLPDSGTELFFASGDPATQRMRIYSSKKNPSGTWAAPIPVD